MSTSGMHAYTTHRETHTQRYTCAYTYMCVHMHKHTCTHAGVRGHINGIQQRFTTMSLDHKWEFLSLRLQPRVAQLSTICTDELEYSEVPQPDRPSAWEDL